MRKPVHAMSLGLEPQDVARYFLRRAFEDGELLSNLKMQKLVYYAYAWALVKDNVKLFTEDIQAWINGPVVPSLFQELKRFGVGPITEEWIQGYDLDKVLERISPNIREILDEVYETYGSMSAFELVALTHSEKPWLNAREGLRPSDQSGHKIADSDIVAEYGSRKIP